MATKLGGRRGKKGEPVKASAAPGAKEQKWNQQADKSLSAAGFSEQDIEFMKKAIQVLCQSTNPLGKSIDFVSDDIESMNKEYEHWRKEANSCLSQYQEQTKITE